MLNNEKYNIIVILPVLCASIFILALTSFFLGEEYARHLFVRPSSTSGLIYLFLPVIIAVFIFKIAKAGIIGLTLGLVLSGLMYVLRLRKISKRSIYYFGIIPALAVIFTSGFLGYSKVKRYHVPGVIYTDGRISKRSIPQKAIVENAKSISSEQKEKSKQILWNDEKMTLSFTDDTIKIVDSNGDMIVEALLHHYDYIREITLVKAQLFQNEKQYLAILADLRTTSRHAMLLIYSPEGEIVYQELLEERSDTIEIDSGKLPTLNIEELIVKNQECFVYSSQISTTR